MGPIHDNFTPWWQTHLLRIGEPHKMPRDLRHSKRCRDLSALLLESLVSGKNHVLNLEFSLCMSECLVKVRDTAMLLFHCSPSSHLLLRQPSAAGLSYHCLMQLSSSQYLPKILFYITSGFVTSCFKQHCTSSCKVIN